MTNQGEIDRRLRQVDNEVFEIYSKLDRISGTQHEHGERLDEHGRQLTELAVTQHRHGDMLTEQRGILAQHGAILAEHGGKLDEILGLLRGGRS